ncbi:hypothetical protein, conserved [Eimeria brunetti]|uniref:LisH domain-containing protein n=1 Tax=Eimeria brunetti TaxID=51314 RepID=U6LHK3_9EIME|nr:hypothetical protein, conserved [Eimeria brunetti]
MEQATGKAAPSGSSGSTASSTASTADASGRMLSFLSQSQLRQQLECQVRYFLSGKLLNCTGDGGPFHEYATIEQCVEDQQTAKKSLAFKATLSLVLLWLKAHGFVHTAGVLCPEADMRNSDVLSEEECQTVLQLPKALLKRPHTPCVSVGLQWNLLDSLIDATSQYGTSLASGLPGATGEVSAAERRAASAGNTRCPPSDEKAVSPCRSERGEYTRRAKRAAKGASCPPRNARKQKVESVVSDSDSPARRTAGTDSSKWNDWQEMAQNKMLLLEAHLKGLELRESSKRLFAASEESRSILDQRIATLEDAYEERMRQLEKAVDEATGGQGAYARETTLGTRTTMHGARNKLDGRLARQEEVEARLAERETKLSERERLLDNREKELLKAALRIDNYDLRTEQEESNMMLAQENAVFRSQLSQTRRQLKALEAQLERQANGLGNEPANYMHPAIAGGTGHSEGIAASAKHPAVEKPPAAQRDASSERTAAMALKQEYEGRVARLTDEIQRSNDQLRNKDAEFKLLVVELESARRKNAEAQKRLKKMQKLYEAARATCVQHKKLASSMSLSLSCIDFAVEPPAGLAEGEARDIHGGENVSPNGCAPLYSAADPRELTRNCQSPVHGFGIGGEDYRLGYWGDLNSRLPTTEIHEHNLWNSARDLQKQSYKSQSSQTKEDCLESVRPNFQRCNLLSSERQPLSPGLRSFSLDLGRQTQQPSETPDAINRVLPLSMPPVDSGNTDTEASEPTKCLRVSLERNTRTGSFPLSGDNNNSRLLREDVCKETVSAYRSSAPLLLPEAAAEQPPLRETNSAEFDFHSVHQKQGASENIAKELAQVSEQGAAMDHVLHEGQHATELEHSRQSDCNRSFEPPMRNPPRSGLEPEGNESMGYATARQLLASPENGQGLIVSNAPLNQQEAAAPCSGLGGILNEVPNRDPPTTTIKTEPSVERSRKPQVQAEDSAHTGPSTVVDHHSTLSRSLEEENMGPQVQTEGSAHKGPSTVIGRHSTLSRTPVEKNINPDIQAEDSARKGSSIIIDRHSLMNTKEASSAGNAQEATVTAPRENSSSGGEPLVSPPPVACEYEVPCSSAAAATGLPERSPVVNHRENEGCAGSRLQSPWAEASIASSLPESPQDLSNFPSLCCPVAATIEGIPSPARSKLDSQGSWTAARRKPVLAGGTPASSSPSEHEWLACVSPTDPAIRAHAADSHSEA